MMNMKWNTKVLVIMGCLLSMTLNTQAQFTSTYTPLKYSSSGYKMSESAYLKKLSQKYHTTDAAIIKKYNHYLYSLQVAYANGSREKQYIIEPFVNQYLTAILDSVVRGNRIKGKYEVVCTRYLVPNAFNLGDNRLYINIGLLEQLQNESQLAFLLCHELSHQLLLHVQDTYIANETRAKDKSIKKEIRDINKAKYNKLDKTFQFIKNTQYDYARHSRLQEKSADSMALVLMMKTNYDLREGKTLMNILDHSDEDSTKIIYNNFFCNHTDCILPDWLKPHGNTFTFGKKSELELDKDSAKTHPDIPMRILMMDTVMQQLAYKPEGRKVFIQPQSTFDSLQHCSQFEMIEAYQNRKRYGAVLYYSLRLMKQYPDNTYLMKQAVLAMNELNKSIAKHTVQNYLPIESDDFSEGYNHLLRIIDTTTAAEFDTLYQNFLRSHYSRLSAIPEIQTLYNALTKK